MVSDSATPWTTAYQASMSFTMSQSLPKLMSIESMMPSNHLILCCPLLLLPSIFPSLRVFSSELALCIRWPKYWSFSFSISPSHEYSGVISYRIDWFESHCCPRDSQESSPAPQIKSINSSALSLLYGPTLTLQLNRCNQVRVFQKFLYKVIMGRTKTINLCRLGEAHLLGLYTLFISSVKRRWVRELTEYHWLSRRVSK